MNARDDERDARDERAGAVFDALADATRRQMMRTLAEGGESTATRLAADLPISRQAVAKHLSALSAAGLVEITRAGRETLYRLNPAPLTEAVSWMTAVGAEWDTRLAALQRHLGRKRG